MKTWRLQAHDTWFFRESRPHGSVGGFELGCMFPPPSRTLAGAVRSRVGEALGVDWHAFARGEDQAGGHDLAQRIGRGDDPGELRLRGPFLRYRDARLYPAPAFLMARPDADRSDPGIHRFRIGAPVHCDLGYCCLPVLPERGAKPMDETWLSEQGLVEVLAGAAPRPQDCLRTRDLLCTEPRTAIALSAARTVRRGLFYQTRHLRPKPEFAVELGVDGVDDLSVPDGPLRLGGEGRMAHLSIAGGAPDLPPAPRVDERSRGLILYLLTPAMLANDWRPEGFQPDRQNGVDCWRGELHGVALVLVSAVLGKPLREGGWDMVRHQPRPVQSLVPPGSCFYCRVDGGELQQAIDALHGRQIGDEQALGRGLIAAGLWQKEEFPTELETHQ